MLALCCTISSIGQQSKIDLRDAYIKRGESQKLAGYITLGVGAAALLPSMIMFHTGEGIDYGNLDKALQASGLFLVGFGCLCASAGQFIKSKHNLKKANRLTLEINKPVIFDMGINNRVLPYSVGVGIPIN